MEDRVTEHFDLAGAAVAGMDLNGAVLRIKKRPGVWLIRQRRTRRSNVLPHVGLNAPEKRVGVLLDRMVVIDRLAAGDDELHLASVVTPRSEQPVVGEPCGRVVRSPNNPIAAGGVLIDPIPQSRRRMKQEEMNVAMSGESAQHLEMAGRQTSEPKKREPLRQIDESQILLKIRASTPNPLSRVGHTNTCAKPPPELSLPPSSRRNPTILTGSPSANELGPMNRIPVVEIREMPNRGEPPSTPSSLSRIIAITALAGTPEMSSKRGKPRLIEAAINNLNQRPNSPLRKPRIPLRIDPRSSRNSVADQPPRRRKLNVGANTVGPTITGAKSNGHPLGKPPLHTARRHRNDISGERIGKRIGEQGAKRPDQAVGPFSSVNVKHGEGTGGACEAALLGAKCPLLVRDAAHGKQGVRPRRVSQLRGDQPRNLKKRLRYRLP